MTNVTRNAKSTKVQAPIVEALKKAYENPTYQFHIPGHTKGNGSLPEFRKLVGRKALCVDTTDEFDNLGTLHPATGPIKEAQELAAKAFGAKKTFFLLNGSTAGNLALAMGLTKKGQKIITNRNCHRSVLTGMIISGAEPLWLIPNRFEEWGIWGNVSPESVEEMLKSHDDAAMVWITNPTYEGVVSDIKSISAVCRRYGVPLIVDEAHACLWNFSKHLPTPALQLGADAVVHSLHKTGGSMSQSSMLHIAENSMIDVDAVEKALKLLHTTSPSLMLLASLDAARANLDSVRGRKQLERAISNAKYLRREIEQMEHIHDLKPDFGYLTDVTKVFIRADGLSGKRLESILEIDFNIEVESASDAGLLLLSNIGNTKADMEYLVKCLKQIDKTQYSDICYLEKKKHMPMLTPVIKKSLREAYYSPKETIPKDLAVGRISAEVIAECPPGIAILLPGELITEAHLPYLTDYDFIEVLK
ncbi:TPA: aminotransferase class I/II-fold pyridoxal phosphate-dependent enzyme [Candidatus Scatousia excrementigallinarum]|uniref:Aminotransferase class I/II-fold pyridoxal phosphate-dependent enzyme n=1 Tax=Candidatus Scatousia excrementigallinarum TaxID=2840935 RepID=A0A9D1JM61_9BACT|nr:aminotransferase class I/II-fold pyridoxal phosphate-dependent enzyme [Candidatus Scatousia excrementigallinarum]